MKLYHFTTPEAAQAFVESRFGNDRGGSIWFSADPVTICGEDSRRELLEVELAASESEVDPFRRHVQEEVYDEESGEWVDDHSAVPYHWLELPQDFVHRTCVSVRILTFDEIKELLM